MKEGEKIDCFILKWQKQLDSAIAGGDNMYESSMYVILMGALPQSWMTFISIHSDDTNLNLQNLVAKLTQDELRKRNTTSQYQNSHNEE